MGKFERSYHLVVPYRQREGRHPHSITSHLFQHRQGPNGCGLRRHSIALLPLVSSYLHPFTVGGYYTQLDKVRTVGGYSIILTAPSNHLNHTDNGYPHQQYRFHHPIPSLLLINSTVKFLVNITSATSAYPITKELTKVTLTVFGFRYLQLVTCLLY